MLGGLEHDPRLPGRQAGRGGVGNMKWLESPTMRKLMQRGIRVAKESRRPSDGGLIPLFTVQKKNGWYYQVDLVRDSRFFHGVQVHVYGFRPPKVSWAKSAEYVFKKEVST